MGTNTPGPRSADATPQEVKEADFGSSYQTTEKIEIVTVSIDEIATSDDE